MKRDVADYVARCLTCQHVKAGHQKSVGLLQWLEIPEWKWERIMMDFMVGLPSSLKGYYSIWVIVDRLTKVTYLFRLRPLLLLLNMLNYT